METPILISFTIDTLFDEIQRQNQYRSKALTGQNGESLFLKYAIMDRDQKIITGFIKDGFTRATDLLIGFITGGEGTVTITDETLTLTVDGAQGDDTEAKNNLQRVLNYYLVEYALKKWYDTKGLIDELKVANLREEEINLKQAIVDLKISKWY